MSKGYYKCPRQVPPEIWQVISTDEPEPTSHNPDIGEEAAIADDAIYWLGYLGVDPPILLSQEKSYPPSV